MTGPAQLLQLVGNKNWGIKKTPKTTSVAWRVCVVGFCTKG